MTANHDKCHLLKNTDCEMLLRTMVDRGLRFKNYLHCVYFELHNTIYEFNEKENTNEFLF